MKHGVAFRKLSRTTSHRMLMLRNLVTSLIKHEQIKTTLPKAREAARLAEKIITLGKKGDLAAYQRANAFLLETHLVPKVFGSLAARYTNRVGGYTRIHKFGNRPGDNAPHAILELVDNPRDIKFDITARAVGWELLGNRVRKSDPHSVINAGVDGVLGVIRKERALKATDKGELREKTRWSLQKVLRFRGREGLSELHKKAEDHIDTLLAKPVALKQMIENADGDKSVTTTSYSLLPKAGQSVPGWNRSALHLAQGALGKTRSLPKWVVRRKLGISDPSAAWS